MKVKCISNVRNSLPINIQKLFRSGEELLLIIDKEYLVYGFDQRGGLVEYFVCQEGVSEYPVGYPSDLFEVLDPSLSRYWDFSIKREKNGESGVFVTFPEWKLNNCFYDSLTDGDDEEVKIFKKYKALMDLEFPDLTIKEIAKIGDENWLLCPNCLDAWESKNILDAMVICGNCQRKLHNPRYQGVFPILPKG